MRWIRVWLKATILMMLASVIVPCANVLTKNIVISPENGIFKHILTRRSLVGVERVCNTPHPQGSSQDAPSCFFIRHAWRCSTSTFGYTSSAYSYYIFHYPFSRNHHACSNACPAADRSHKLREHDAHPEFCISIKVSTGTVRQSLRAYFAVLHPVALPLLIFCIKESAKRCVRNYLLIRTLFSTDPKSVSLRLLLQLLTLTCKFVSV